MTEKNQWMWICSLKLYQTVSADAITADDLVAGACDCSFASLSFQISCYSGGYNEKTLFNAFLGYATALSGPCNQ